jgi:hypothetical protein
LAPSHQGHLFQELLDILQDGIQVESGELNKEIR